MTPSARQNYEDSCRIHRDIEARKRELAPILAEERRQEREHQKAAKRRKLARRRAERRKGLRYLMLAVLWRVGVGK